MIIEITLPRTVAGLTGLRLRVMRCCNHFFACPRNVWPISIALTLLNCSVLLAPNEFKISTFRRWRSDLVSGPRTRKKI